MCLIISLCPVITVVPPTAQADKLGDDNAQLLVARREEEEGNQILVLSDHKERYSQKKSVCVCSETNPFPILSPAPVTWSC